jgi:hypothetical protein
MHEVVFSTVKYERQHNFAEQAKHVGDLQELP